MQPAVIAAIIAALVTAIGWFVAYLLAKRREDDTRRLESTLRHLERQIEEFYGPLFNLVHQIVIANHVQHKILSGAGSAQLARDRVETVQRMFRKRFFFPVHAEVNEILKTRLHLVEGTQMPDVFYRYLRHALQEQAQAALWEEHQVDTGFVPGEPYPNELYGAVKSGLDHVMEEYDRLTRALAVTSRSAQPMLHVNEA